MFRMLLLALALLGSAPVGHAQTSPTPAEPAAPLALPPAPLPEALTPAQAREALDVLRDDSKRAQFLSVLETLARTLPTVPPSPAAPAHPLAAARAAAAHPASAPTTAAKSAIPLVPNSLGAEILVGASDRLSQLSTEFGDLAHAVTDFPLLTRWLVHIARDPDTRSDLLDAAWKLAVALAAALAAERVVWLLVRRPIRSLAQFAPAPERDAHPERHRIGASALTLLHRLPYVLGRAALDLLPMLTVAAVGYAVLSTPLGAPTTTRLVILAVLNAYVLCRVVITVTRLLVSPDLARLRLAHLSDAGAAYVVTWVRRIAVLAIFGYAVAEVALLFGLYRVAHDALLNLVSLSVHIALVIVVLQKRREVAEWIRGRPDARGPMAVLRKRAARIWHVVAIFYLIALWLVWALEVPDGFARLVRIFVSSVILIPLARLISVALAGAIERTIRVDPSVATRFPGLEARARRYNPIARLIVHCTIGGAVAVVLFQIWGLDSLAWFADGALGGRVIGALITIGVTLLFALLAWELANAGVERHLARLSRDAKAARSARLLTLLPMLRTVLLVAICLFAALMVLSEIGVNIAPLLAGAGVVGLAIGFGSQKLVQDIITGLFLLLENAMQVGDVVTLGGMSGSVENLSIRTIRLRALDGSVHIVPFSAVTTVTNMTRDYGYAVLDVGVGLSEAPHHIADVVRDVARTMRAEPRWGGAIRDDIEILGIERFVDLAYVLRVRVMTLPGQRWAVARELNERIKVRFDELAIDSPITSYKAIGQTPLTLRAAPAPPTGMVAE